MMNVGNITFQEDNKTYLIDNNIEIYGTSGKSFGWADRLPVIHELVRQILMWICGVMDITAPDADTTQPPVVISVRRDVFVGVVERRLPPGSEVVAAALLRNIIEVNMDEAVQAAISPSFFEFVRSEVMDRSHAIRREPIEKLWQESVADPANQLAWTETSFAGLPAEALQTADLTGYSSIGGEIQGGRLFVILKSNTGLAKDYVVLLEEPSVDRWVIWRAPDADFVEADIAEYELFIKNAMQGQIGTSTQN